MLLDLWPSEQAAENPYRLGEAHPIRLDGSMTFANAIRNRHRLRLMAEDDLLLLEME